MDQTRNSKTSHATDAELLHRAKSIVDDFVEYLANQPIGMDVVDASELPHSRKMLVNAFRLLIATELRPKIRERLRTVGATLAQFQDDIGQRMCLRPAEDGGGVPSDAELERLIKEHRHQLAKFDRAFKAVDPERNRLDALFRKSMHIAERRQWEHIARASTYEPTAAFH